MKKLGLILALVLGLVAPVSAEVRSIKICDAKTLAASTTTDCAYTDITNARFFSYQLYCGETTGSSMNINVDWVAGSNASTAYMAVPLLSSGSAMSQLRTAYTTEDAWSVLHTIQPPVSPVGTIRLTETLADDDIVCTVILNMGD